MIDVTVASSAACAAERIEFSPTPFIRERLDAAERFSGLAWRALLGDIVAQLPVPSVERLPAIPAHRVMDAKAQFDALLSSSWAERPARYTLDAHAWFASFVDRAGVIRSVRWTVDLHSDFSAAADLVACFLGVSGASEE